MARMQDRKYCQEAGQDILLASRTGNIVRKQDRINCQEAGQKILLGSRTVNIARKQDSKYCNLVVGTKWRQEQPKLENIRQGEVRPVY